MLLISLHATHSNRLVPKPQITAQASQSAADLQLVHELKARDREVRTHEQAHLAAAGGLAHSGPSYQFKRGPDGRQYATGGEVKIDVSPVVNDPKATLAKAQKITRAALAPAQPSQADRNVAARANAMALQAHADLQRESQSSDNQENNNSGNLGRKIGNPYDRALEPQPSTFETYA